MSALTPAHAADSDKWFSVVSAVCQSFGSFDEPPEQWREHLWVKARTANRARVLMVRAWRRRTKGGRAWKLAPWLDDGNPFRGMVATRASAIPEDHLPCEEAWTDPEIEPAAIHRPETPRNG